MKISKIVFVSIVMLLFFANLLFAVTTDDVPTAYKMRMPIVGQKTGEDLGDNLDLLTID